MEVENISRRTTTLRGCKALILLLLVVIDCPNSHTLVAARVAARVASPSSLQQSVTASRSNSLNSLVATRVALIPTLSTQPLFTTDNSPQRSASGTVSSGVQPVATPFPSAIAVPNSTLHDDLCLAGPELKLDEIEQFYITGYVYIEVGSPVNCSGFITAWDICYGVFAFRDELSEIWPCVWREKNGTYSLVGQNMIGFIPSQDNSTGNIRCREDEKADPYDYIEVEVGDFIGFFLPDNGLFVPEVNDPNANQLRREALGFVNQVNASELIEVGTNQRALVRARIGRCMVLPYHQHALNTIY